MLVASTGGAACATCFDGMPSSPVTTICRTLCQPSCSTGNNNTLPRGAEVCIILCRSPTTHVITPRAVQCRCAQTKHLSPQIDVFVVDPFKGTFKRVLVVCSVYQESIVCPCNVLYNPSDKKMAQPQYNAILALSCSPPGSRHSLSKRMESLIHAIANCCFLGSFGMSRITASWVRSECHA